MFLDLPFRASIGFEINLSVTSILFRNAGQRKSLPESAMLVFRYPNIHESNEAVQIFSKQEAK